MITSRSSAHKSLAMERRLSSNSESSIEPLDASGKTSCTDDTNKSSTPLPRNSTDQMESEEAFESDDRQKSDDDEREETAGDADVDEDDENGNSAYKETKKHGHIVRRENLRQLESMTLRKKFRYSAGGDTTNDWLPNNNNNTNKNNNNSKGSLRIDSSENSDANGNVTSSQYICPICSVCSATQHEFTEHIRGHNNSDGSHNYTCQICFKVVSSASSLDRHVLVHTGERPFTCRYCHLTFTTNGNMHRHMRTHKHRDGLAAKNAGTLTGPATDDDVASTETTASFGDRFAVRPRQNGRQSSILPRSPSKADVDGLSDDSTDDSSGSTSHTNYRLVDGKRKIVDDDYASVSLKRRLKTINNNSHIENNNQSTATSTANQRFCCPVCVRNDFPNMLSLETHVDKEHPSVQAKCRYCEIVFKSYKTLNAHKCGASHKASHVTQGFKDLTFVDFSSEKFPLIAKSMCEQSIRTPITNQKYECPKCYRAFPCLSAVDIHVKCCGMPAELIAAKDFSVRKRLLSDSTSDEEARRDDFFAHLDLKNKNANMNNSLAESLPSTGESDGGEQTPNHLDIKHERYSPQMHQNDSKDLADIQSIINVTSSGGGFLRQFEKPVAMMSSSSVGEIGAVQDLPFGAREEDEEVQDAFTIEFRKMKLRGEFPCKLCKQIFPNLRALKGHNRQHYGSGPGPYRCNMCPFLSDDKARLVQHMRNHNGDTPYECAICSYKFTTKANCERHLRNRHGKTTREEVKRSIIYHPSEDSSCDDPIKKMQIYNSSFDDDEQYSNSTPAPIHVKDNITTTPEKTAKIQVKSIEQLIQQQQQQQQQKLLKRDDESKPVADSKPMDLSMDALDLSKKNSDDDKDSMNPLAKLDLSQQMLLAQQQLLSETLPKIDPAHYFQLTQLYRNLVFPGTGFPLHPFFMQNPLLAAAQLSTPNLSDLKDLHQSDVLSTPQHNMFSGGSMLINPIFPTPPNMSQPNVSLKNMMQESMKHEKSPSRALSPARVQLPVTPQTPRTSHTSSHHQVKMQNTPSHQPSLSPGPVKMVIKNGVLMPKQKQRRYRTERPFACEHCSARFTLRSNMERHIKQQHPQYWAQRQRSGHNIMRRSSAGNMAPSPQPSNQASPASNALIDNQNLFSAIPEQVKYAILAKQLKSRNDKSASSNFFDALAQRARQNQFNKPPTPHDEDDNESNLVIDEDTSELAEPEDLTSRKSTPDLKTTGTDVNLAAKKVAENILEEAMKTSSANIPISPVGLTATAQSTPKTKVLESKLFSNLTSRQDKYFKDVADSGFGSSPANSSSIKEEGDLVSVSKLVDNATNSMSFGSYFQGDTQPNEQSDEEGLVASGSASESNNSGTEDPNPNGGILAKKKSAYSLAPNRVACPYCQRMFPWSSSLRRHILTHTGQKPFKCSHCPLLFTTKSNCDRHLLRKHGDVESAVSLYVPIEDVTEPVKEPTPEPPPPVREPSPLPLPQIELNIPQLKNELPGNIVSSDLPFKCHLCDGSFPDRITCLEHIKNYHPQEFALLLSKGAIEPDADGQTVSAEDDERQLDGGRGKYPDYANRKVICAFCVRRFWSTEDLRRHMRTHSGERPFQCKICMRKFTLKHSMLRHQKKHAHNSNANQMNSANSASDLSDDEQSVPSTTAASIATNLLLNNSALSTAAAMKLLKIPDLIPKDLSAWKAQIEHKENIASALLRGNSVDHQRDNEETSELIGNLLGISDSSILNRVLLSSADEAAKLLGVEK